MPPFTLFSLRCDPDGVLERLQELLPNIAVKQEGSTWRTATGVWKRGFLKKSLKLEIKHDPEYYSDKASFAVQTLGLANYVRRFPGAENKAALFSCIQELRFALPFIFEPDPEPGDPRLDVLANIATMLDGFVFLPHVVLDACGQVILSADGRSDPGAVIPAPPARGNKEPQDEAHTEDDPPLSPPPPDRVARRFQILIASAVRGFVEQENAEMEEKESFTQHLLKVLRKSGAWEEAEPEEKRCLETGVGQLSGEDVWTMTWQCEAAALLAWALHLGEQKPYHEMVQAWDLLHNAGLGRRENSPSPHEIIKQATLRSSEELESMESCIFAVHWRLREFSLRPQPMDFRAFAETAWFGPLNTGLVNFAGADLGINGKPISECRPEEWKAAAGIVQQRHQAINWLRGHSALFSETDTST